jgi:5,5'-dehydrodivanillate O-demethylase
LVFAYLGEGEPPPLPRYPDFEQDGVRLVRGRVRRCNYFSDVENSTDLFHVAWAHREARDAGSMHSLDYVPSSLAAEESDWGITATVTLANGSTRTNQFGMPTMLHFRSGNEAIEEGGTDPTNVILWRVPITDEEHANFSVRLIQITGASAERFLENRRTRAASSYIAANDLADIVLRGEVRTQDVGQREDVRRWEIVNVQDDVTQVGQGIIPDRDQERRGATDVGVVLLREIWKRELRALAEGRRLKPWTRPAGMAATSGQ